MAERAVTPKYPFEEFMGIARSTPALLDAVERRLGLRLNLSAQPFEGLVCSLLSQNTSVKRWRDAASSLSRRFGEEVGGLHSFPTPSDLADATVDELRACRTGYRAPYLRAASRWAADGNIHYVDGLSTGEAREELLALRGVGPKVADCVLLYALGRFEAAPIDVHMRRRLGGSGYGDCSDTLRERFGEHAGLAQLYLYDDERRG